MTTDHITTSWRQFEDQLTLRQIQQFTMREASYPELRPEVLLCQARQDVEANRTDRERFGDVSEPTGAVVLHHWEVDTDEGGWRRLFDGRHWQVGGLDARVVGQQSADGTVTAKLAVDCGAGGSDFTAGELRRIAEAMVQAADELDTIWAVETS